jgi:hypothetical protein
MTQITLCSAVFVAAGLIADLAFRRPSSAAQTPTHAVSYAAATATPPPGAVLDPLLPRRALRCSQLRRR